MSVVTDLDSPKTEFLFPNFTYMFSSMSPVPHPDLHIAINNPMSKVPKLSLAKLASSNALWPSSPLKRVSRQLSFCPTPIRSQSLETSALHFQPKTLKSLAHERTLFKTLRQIQTDRLGREPSISTDLWEFKVSTVTSEWKHFRAATRQVNPFAIVKHFTVSPRPLSSERASADNSKRLLDLAEATKETLQKAFRNGGFSRTKPPEQIPEVQPRPCPRHNAVSKVGKPVPKPIIHHSGKQSNIPTTTPKLREKKDTIVPEAETEDKKPIAHVERKMPKTAHTKSCSHLANKQSASLLSRLRTPVLANRK